MNDDTNITENELEKFKTYLEKLNQKINESLNPGEDIQVGYALLIFDLKKDTNTPIMLSNLPTANALQRIAEAVKEDLASLRRAQMKMQKKIRKDYLKRVQ